MDSLGVAKYGMPAAMVEPAQPFGTGVSNGAVTTRHAKRFLDAENPDLWLVGIGAVTLGLIAFSTSVHIGPLALSASV